MTGALKLADVLAAERNSFNLVRLAAACAVVVSHAVLLTTGQEAAEPLAAATPFTLGQHAVNAFFVISGLTLSASLARNGDLLHYASARALRIFPALLAFGVLFAFAAGPLLTALPLRDYFADPDTWLYPVLVLVEFSHAPPPHEIFTASPFAAAVNTPLWTIKYEIAAYIGLACLSAFGLQRRPAVAVLLLAATFAVLSFTSGPAHHEPVVPWPYHLGRYGFCFALGMLAFQCRDRLTLAAWPLAVTGALMLALLGSRFDEAGCIVFVAHLVLVAGGRTYGILSTATRRHDLSYGIYIYGWPVQQALVTLIPGIGAVAVMGLSFAIVPLLALASWLWVERPALALKRLNAATAGSGHLRSA